MPCCRRLFHSPIIKYSTILVRHVATCMRAFYLLNTTAQGPQIYELVAGSSRERTKWMKHITEAAACKPGPGAEQLQPGQLTAAEKDKAARGSKAPSCGSRLEAADRQNSSPPEGFNIPDRKAEAET